MMIVATQHGQNAADSRRRSPRRVERRRFLPQRCARVKTTTQPSGIQVPYVKRNAVVLALIHRIVAPAIPPLNCVQAKPGVRRWYVTPSPGAADPERDV
jgi:hypothetical protein